MLKAPAWAAPLHVEKNTRLLNEWAFHQGQFMSVSRKPYMRASRAVASRSGCLPLGQTLSRNCHSDNDITSCVCGCSTSGNCQTINQGVHVPLDLALSNMDSPLS